MPKEQLLTVAFENDKYGLVDIFRAADRRIGKERRAYCIEKINKIKLPGKLTNIRWICYNEHTKGATGKRLAKC